MKHDPQHILISIISPTRILGVVPHFFGLTLLAPFVGGTVAYAFNQACLFWALFLLIVMYGVSLYLTFLDEDFIRVKKLQNKFKKTRNYRSEGIHKYVS